MGNDSIWEKLKESIDWVTNAVKEFLEWAGSEKTQQTVKGILEIAVLVAQIVEKFNAPLSGTEKAAFVRQFVRMLKYATEEEITVLSSMMESLKSCNKEDIDGLEAHELDIILGPAIGMFLSSNKKDKEPGAVLVY